jgi:hypothetical protein
MTSVACLDSVVIETSMTRMSMRIGADAMLSEQCRGEASYLMRPPCLKDTCRDHTAVRACMEENSIRGAFALFYQPFFTHSIDIECKGVASTVRSSL